MAVNGLCFIDSVKQFYFLLVTFTYHLLVNLFWYSLPFNLYCVVFYYFILVLLLQLTLYGYGYQTSSEIVSRSIAPCS